MRYTQTDYANALAAKRDFALGSKIAQVVIAGKSITYHRSEKTIELLDFLIATIEAELGTISLRTYAKNAGRGL